MKRGPRSPAEAKGGVPRVGQPAAGSTSPEARHPDVEEFVDFADGRSGVAARRKLQAHLDICPSCARLTLDLTRIVLSLVQEGVETPPPALSRWARSLPDRLPPSRSGRAPAASNRTTARGASPFGNLRSGTLRLIADSWARGAGASPPAISAGAVRSLEPGAAGAALAGRRRLLLSATPFDLDIQLDYRGSDDPRQLRGQILPIRGTRHDWMGSEVRLVAGRRTVVRGRADRRGEFVLPRVPPGRYRIEVSAGSSAGAARSTSPVLEV